MTALASFYSSYAAQLKVLESLAWESYEFTIGQLKLSASDLKVDTVVSTPTSTMFVRSSLAQRWLPARTCMENLNDNLNTYMNFSYATADAKMRSRNSSFMQRDAKMSR